MAVRRPSRPPATPGFELVLRGFSPPEVIDHLGALSAVLDRVTADRDAAVTRADRLASHLDAERTSAECLHAQITRIAAAPDTVAGITERLEWMMQVHRDEVSQLRARAEDDAEATRAAAHAKAAEVAEDIRRQLEHLGAECARLPKEIDRNRSETRAELDRLAAEADHRRATLDAEAQAHRAEADEDFAISQAARRVESAAEHAELEARCREQADRIRTEAEAEAERLVAEASDTARRMVDEARAEVTRQLEGRARLHGQAESTPAGDRVAASRAEAPAEGAPGARHSDEPAKLAS